MGSTLVRVRARTINGNQQLTAHVPLKELLLTEIFAVGYDKNGTNVGRVSLGYTGATAIHEALWGSQSTPPR